MKILLTGASGFIGSHLLHALVKLYGKDSIFAFSSREIAGVNCIIYKGVRDFELDEYDFSDFTHLIHAGAFIPKNSDQANEIISCNNNIYFTEALLNLTMVGLERVIYLSTIDIYSSDETITSELSTINPVSLYGASKFYCENLIKSYSVNQNIEYMNLRIGHVYGPGEDKYKKVLPLAIVRLLNNEAIEIWGDGGELRSFIFIGDVIKVIVNALNYMPANLDINVVSGNSVTIRDLIAKIIEISGKDVCPVFIESNHPRRNLIFDNKRLAETLLERELDLDVGLKEEYNYMKYRYENDI